MRLGFILFLELISDTYKERMHIVGFQYSPACFTFCSKTIPSAFFEGELCRQENLRSGNRFLCGGTAKEWPLGNRGLRGQH